MTNDTKHTEQQNNPSALNDGLGGLDLNGIVEIILAEFSYWKEADVDQSIGGMGSASNILAAIKGHRAPWHPEAACVRLWRMEKENTALLKTIRQYDSVIQAVATALGGVCCGGIDVEGPGSTKEVLVGAIEKLKAEQRIWMGS